MGGASCNLAPGATGFHLQLLPRPLTPAQCIGKPFPRPPRDGPDVSLALARELLRQVNHTGCEIRKDPTVLEHPNIWPRRSIPSKWWRWKEKLSAQWKQPEHINILELRAVLASLRWRCKTGHIKCKFFHLLDSAVCMGVVSAARSPSWQLAVIQDKINCLLLAGGMRMVLAHVSTHENPADRPSRNFRAAKVRKHHLKTGRR